MPDFIDQGPLPEFDDPPVVETVPSVQFREFPRQTDDEPAHAVVFRTDGGRDLQRSVKQRFAE